MSALHDHVRIAALRGEGRSWRFIADALGVDDHRELCRTHRRWSRRRGGPPAPASRSRVLDDAVAEIAGYPVDNITDPVLLTAPDVARITTLADLLEFFRVDLDVWDVTGFRVNKWEQHSAAAGVVPLYQVRATLAAKSTPAERALDESIRAALAEIGDHAPDFSAPAPESTAPRWLSAPADPVSLTIHPYDPHLGMLAWGAETGESYDLKIAVDDYGAAVDRALAFSHFYPVGEILLVIGNDMIHADGPSPGTGGKGGATTKGTAQDLDTRLAKVFTAARKAAVRAVERALLVPAERVVVQLVPGNHDHDTIYKLGEVLLGWFRNTPRVEIRYGPAKRAFYRFGKTALMLTHGEEYKRQRDSLPLLFATECPPDIWAGTTYREVLTGHNHIAMAGRYSPTSDLFETRAIRVRSLPGLTATDAWHAEEGYKHHRAATAIAYRKSGGVVGIHEFSF